MLELRNLTKYYGDFLAVDNISLTIADGEFATLLGPSGCGKSTTLHMVAGLLEPTEGSILINGKDVTAKPPNERNIGMVFQNTALFPHMTVRENIAYGLRMRDAPKSEIQTRIDELLNMVEMSDHGDHKPGELSGGQKQRIAIARAIAFEPELLLLDEPLTGLDRVLRESMRREIERIQNDVGVTTLYVTHDQKEALSMSDNVIVMNNGVKQQEGEPKDIYTNPQQQFVAEFIGKSTILSGEVMEGDGMQIQTSIGEIEAADSQVEEVGNNVNVYLRPEHVQIESERNGHINEFEGKIIDIENLGEHAEVHIRLPSGTIMIAKMDGFPSVDVGMSVYVSFEPSEVIAL